MRHALIVATLLAAPTGARSQCAERLAALEPKADTIADARFKALFTYDMRQARNELRERDERECQRILDHAERLLAGG